jgi:hypothetical protein
VVTIDPEKERQRLAQVYAGMSEGELEKLADEAWSLTELAREALKAELLRRRLGITLRDSAVKEDKFSKLVTLRQYVNVPEALVAKSILDSAGAECFLFDENVVRINWFLSNAVGGIKLRVGEEDVAAAAALLDHGRGST